MQKTMKDSNPYSASYKRTDEQSDEESGFIEAENIIDTGRETVKSESLYSP